MTAIIKTILCCQALLGAGALPTKTRGLRGAAKTIGGLKTFDGDYSHKVKTTLELVSTALSRHTFGYASAFDQDLSDWAVQSVTDMERMFYEASAFDQDLGWCVGDGVYLGNAFTGTVCAISSCGIADFICQP